MAMVLEEEILQGLITARAGSVESEKGIKNMTDKCKICGKELTKDTIHIHLPPKPKEKTHD